MFLDLNTASPPEEHRPYGGLQILRPDHPRPDESFFGYLVRIAELNGYDNGAWLLQLAGITKGLTPQRWGGLFLNQTNLPSLAHLMAVPTEELQGLAIRNAQFSSCRLRFPYRLDLRTYGIGAYAKICPECLVELPYCRDVWDAPFVTGCVRHRRLLLDRCPQCGISIKRLRFAVSHCRCGMDWRKINRTSQLSEIGERFLRAVYAAMHTHPLPNSGGLPDHNPLFSKTLESMLRSLLFVGSQFRSLSRTSRTARLTNSQFHRWLVRSFSVYEYWPHRFNLFLNWKNKRSRRLHGTPATSAEIKRCECKRSIPGNEPATPPLNVATRVRESARFESAINPGYTSIEKAKRQLGLPLATIQCHIDNGTLIKTWLRDSKPWRAVIETKSVARLKASLRAGLSRTEMAKRIGVTKEYVDDLVRLQCLAPLWTSEYEYVLASDAPSQLLERLRQAVRAEYPQATENDTPDLQTILDTFGLRIHAGAMQVNALLGGFVSDWVCRACGRIVPRKQGRQSLALSREGVSPRQKVA